MGRDTVQLETAVSTISQEYLLEFTSEYGISEDLHPKLPGPGERILDFPKGEDEMPAENTYSREAVMVLNTHRTPIQKQPEALLLLVGLSRRYLLGDEVYPTFLHDDDRDPVAATDSSGGPSIIERSPLDFSNEDPSQQSTGGNETEDQGHEAVALEVPPPKNVTTTRVAPKTGQVERIAATGPRSTIGGKSLTAMGLGMGSTCPVPTSRDTLVDVSDPDPLSFADPQSLPTAKVAKSSKGAAVAEDLESENTSFTSMVGSPESIYRPEWGVTNGCLLDALEACQDVVDHIAPPGYFLELRHLHNDDFLKQYNINLARKMAMGSQLRLTFEQEAKLLNKSVALVARRDKRIQARENEIKNLETLLEAEIDMKKTAEVKNAELGKELENLRALFSDLQVSNDRLSQQLSTFQAQVTGEENLKAAFKEFKQYENNRVEKSYVEMNARLDALSIDFDEELYPHMLTAIIGHRWVIRHRLCLAVMKCGESTELRQVFADVVSAGIAKSDTGDDAPQWIRELRPSSSQLKIPVYPKVRDPTDPLACKEEILLADAITANVSRAKKKKKCRMVCRIYGVSSAHHARSDGVPVSVPAVAPQGLVILLTDAATQMEISKDGASPMLLRSSSLPAMHNLD
uniref:Transposase (Putative), gypsy type n=1 Tax=Tanacetum cinerariifolium TaxID=118510 RepID=A0A6L2LLG6_TANCI|nr:hypothetical protein [Tanacetum cinerariifolium]